MKALLIALAILAPHPTSNEDEPGWDCRYDGNRICGVNPWGYPPGDYSNPNCWPGAIYCPTDPMPDPTIVER